MRINLFEHKILKQILDSECREQHSRFTKMYFFGIMLRFFHAISFNAQKFYPVVFYLRRYLKIVNS